MTFPATTPNAGLPLLFAGQAQKEFFVNQALTILDAMAPRAVIASLSAPPANPDEGACFLVATPGTGAWHLKDEHLAIRVGGSWHFVAPAEGMMVFDRAAGRWICFRSGWQSAPPPPAPTGGAVIDVEARAALMQLVESLQTLGLIAPAST
jgi:hypothetical protein